MMQLPECEQLVNLPQHEELKLEVCSSDVGIQFKSLSQTLNVYFVVPKSAFKSFDYPAKYITTQHIWSRTGMKQTAEGTRGFIVLTA